MQILTTLNISNETNENTPEAPRRTEPFGQVLGDIQSLLAMSLTRHRQSSTFAKEE
jgi:hypothetical protein